MLELCNKAREQVTDAKWERESEVNNHVFFVPYFGTGLPISAIYLLDVVRGKVLYVSFKRTFEEGKIWVRKIILIETERGVKE
jgi:hypothetical protein